MYDRWTSRIDAKGNVSRLPPLGPADGRDSFTTTIPQRPDLVITARFDARGAWQRQPPSDLNDVHGRPLVAWTCSSISTSSSGM
jgi:hypothetical protein